VGTTVMLAVKLLTAVNWQWYVLIGSLTTLATGAIASHLVSEAAPRAPAAPAA
jgi:hypothetical protein